MKLWPVCIISFFVLFAGAMVGFVVWSTHQRTDLVSRDYYDQEIKYQQRIDATRRTAEQDLVPKVAFDAATGNIAVQFASAAMTSATGRITLYRPSEAELDQSCELKPDAAGAQLIAAANLKPGLWRVKTEWSTAGQSFYAEDSVVVQ